MLKSLPRVFLGICSLVLGYFVLALSASAQTGTFSDIVVNVKSEPKGSSTHGYAEYVFVVTNRSDRAHTVTLALPHDMSRGHQDDYIRSLSRTVQVDARGTVQVPLLQPDYPSMGGEGLKVIVDGREEKDGVRVAMAQGGRQGAYHDGYRGRGGRYYLPTKSKGMGEENQPLVLVSPRVSSDKFRFDNPDKPGVALEGAPGRAVHNSLGVNPGGVMCGWQRRGRFVPWSRWRTGARAGSATRVTTALS